ncbi:MAG: hypothetical protein V9G20_15025 [Candidatus Promineifilaceae bacterium]
MLWRMDDSTVLVSLPLIEPVGAGYTGNYLEITVNQASPTNLVLTLYDAEGHYLSHSLNYDFLTNRNDESIPYIGFAEYSQDASIQTITYYAPPEGAYRVELTGGNAVNYTVQIKTYNNNTVISNLSYTNNIGASEVQSLDLNLVLIGGNLVASATPPLYTDQITAPEIISQTVYANLPFTLDIPVTEITGLYNSGIVTADVNEFMTGDNAYFTPTILSSTTPYLNAGQTAQLSITLSTNALVPEAIYDGSIVIYTESGQVRVVPVHLTVQSPQSIFMPFLQR